MISVEVEGGHVEFIENRSEHNKSIELFLSEFNMEQ